jgi:hypothetical protein
MVDKYNLTVEEELVKLIKDIPELPVLFFSKESFIYGSNIKRVRIAECIMKGNMIGYTADEEVLKHVPEQQKQRYIHVEI